MKPVKVYTIEYDGTIKDNRRTYVACCVGKRKRHAWFVKPGTALWEDCNDLAQKDPHAFLVVSHDECDECVEEEENRASIIVTLMKSGRDGPTAFSSS